MCTRGKLGLRGDIYIKRRSAFVFYDMPFRTYLIFPPKPGRLRTYILYTREKENGSGRGNMYISRYLSGEKAIRKKKARASRFLG